MKSGSHMTEEHKAKLSTAHMGIIPWNKGKHISNEICVKISTSHMGLKASPETCAKISAGGMGNTNAYGHHMSLEGKTKLSIYHKDKKPALGHHYKASPETCIKLSVSRQGRIFSPETCAKMSKSLIGNKQGWKGGEIESMRRRAFKRHGLGFIPLNESFPGCEGHHYDTEHVIYTLKELHHSIPHNVFTGKNMEYINALVFTWYIEDCTHKVDTII